MGKLQPLNPNRRPFFEITLESSKLSKKKKRHMRAPILNHTATWRRLDRYAPDEKYCPDLDFEMQFCLCSRVPLNYTSANSHGKGG
mmetsp:Transcript_16172/g.28673  ORF Transcript_16172/g.28673 Transcript_16172/m.28673 type:complete len:86 (+) Transcript_16172:76-333(+)